MLIGLTGKPSAGKSTFFKACTLAEVTIANYPFTTLKSQEGVGFITVKCADEEFNTKCNPKFGYCINHLRFVPIRILDVPGLIKGSHIGEGLGNQFLTDLNEADALIHIVDISGSTNEKGEPVQPLTHDPLKDLIFLDNELDHWYYNILKKGWDKFVKIIQENQNIKKALAKQLSGLKITEDIIEDAIKKLKLTHHPKDWQQEDLFNLASLLRIQTKPMIIAANKIDVQGAEYNLKKIIQRFPDKIILPCSSEAELALKEATKHNLIEYIPGSEDFKIIANINENQRKALQLIRENVINKFKTTGVQDILNKAVEFLKYIPVFPVASSKLTDSSRNILPDCFLMKEDNTSLDLAYRIHEDIGKNFIKAIDLKTKRILGKDHKLKYGDVIEIVTAK